MRCVVIPVDGVPYEHELAAGRGKYEEVRWIVGGGQEAVYVRIGGARVTVYVHGEGLILGFPQNAIASRYYPGPTGIAGTVVVLGPVTWDGDDTDVPELAIRELVGGN